MQFVYPAFLWAFLLLAIPVIIHLFSFRRFKKIYFSNVRFLKEIKEETASKSNIKHLLVLISRLLALSALILAFAQPYISDETGYSKTEQQAYVIYIDNSFSMEAAGKQINLLDQSKETAHQLLLSFPVSARFYLITNNKNATYQGEISREEALQAVDRIRVCPLGPGLEQINQNVKEIFRNKTHGIVYLLSDFQQNKTDLIPDSSIQYNLLPAKASVPANLSIDSCWLDAPVFLLERENKLMVRIHNYSKEAVHSIPLSVFINDERKGIDEIDIEANTSLVDTIPFRFSAMGWNLLKLSIQDYPVQFDDSYFQRYYVKSSFQVLELNDGNASEYLKAMQIPGLMQIESMHIKQVNLNGLNKYSLLVLNRIANISSGFAQQLEKYVKQGGSLLILPSKTIASSTLNNWINDMSGIHYASLKNQPNGVNYLEQKYGLFYDVFEKIQKKLRLPKCKKYYPLQYLNKAYIQKLMTLENGDLFMASTALGKGHIFLSSVPALSEYSNWPKSELFAVAIFQMAASEASSLRTSVTIGKEQIIRARQVDVENNQMLHLSNDHIDLIAKQQKTGQDILLHLGTIINESGFYKLGLKDASPIDILAFNYNRQESDLSVFDAKSLKEKYPQPNVNIMANHSTLSFNTLNGFESKRALWKLCLILALGFLAIEILLLRFLKG